MFPWQQRKYNNEDMCFLCGPCRCCKWEKLGAAVSQRTAAAELLSENGRWGTGTAREQRRKGTLAVRSHYQTTEVHTSVCVCVWTVKCCHTLYQSVQQIRPSIQNSSIVTLNQMTIITCETLVLCYVNIRITCCAASILNMIHAQWMSSDKKEALLATLHAPWVLSLLRPFSKHNWYSDSATRRKASSEVSSVWASCH